MCAGLMPPAESAEGVEVPVSTPDVPDCPVNDALALCRLLLDAVLLIALMAGACVANQLNSSRSRSRLGNFGLFVAATGSDVPACTDECTRGVA